MYIIQWKNEETKNWFAIDDGIFELKSDAEKELFELKEQLGEFENSFGAFHETEYRILELKPGHYMADTFYGVQEFDIVDYPEAEFMPCQDFYDELNTLDEGEEIFTYFDYNDLDLLYTIYEEYGIRGL